MRKFRYFIEFEVATDDVNFNSRHKVEILSSHKLTESEIMNRLKEPFPIDSGELVSWPDPVIMATRAYVVLDEIPDATGSFFDKTMDAMELALDVENPQALENALAHVDNEAEVWLKVRREKSQGAEIEKRMDLLHIALVKLQDTTSALKD